MERLPVELVEGICWHLCPHCQSPDHFPNVGTGGALTAKASLARLARTSKAMCAIAQPFVFHYYATGNLPRIYRDPERDPGYCFDEESWPQDNDQLPSFLRSVIRRPDLAPCVRALQLVTPVHHVETNRAWRKGLDGDALPTIRAASAKLGLVAFNPLHPDYDAWAHNTRRGSPSFTIEGLRHVLEQLALLLCPNTATLLLVGTFDFTLSYGKLIQSSGRALPALKTIALLSLGDSDHYAKSGPLLTLAPNLETIYAADIRESVYGFRVGAPAWEGRFPKLQKAVVHDLGTKGLSSLARSCPELRELHYTHTIFNLDPEPANSQAMAAALEPLSKTLRRLSIQVLTWAKDDVIIKSLRHFDKLEELTIHQDALHAPAEFEEQPLPGGLVGFLPRSIVAFNVSHVSHSFEQDLLALARDAPRDLPRLTSVRVSCVESATDAIFTEWTRNELRRRFGEVGIELMWGESIHGDELEDIPGLPIDDGGQSVGVVLAH